MLSVIVPVYNVAAYIEECLDSLDRQTLRDIEIIIVDDGSKDNSYDICSEFIRNKPGFRLYHKENGGLMSAWMFGVRYAAGDYIGFVDSDDYVSDEMYDKMYKIALSGDLDIVMCGRNSVYKNRFEKVSEKNIVDGLYSGDKIEYIHAHAFPSLKGGNISSARWNKIFKKDLFMGNTKYCSDLSRYCEDRYIVPACLMSATSFFYLDEPLYYYRLRKTANSRQPSEDLPDSLLRLVQIQSGMLSDKNMEKYSPQLEISNLNYIQMIINRNLSSKADKKFKLKSIRRILENEEYKRIIAKYPEELTGKFGILLKIAFITKSPALVIFIFDVFHSVSEIRAGKERDNWFD